jgi:hypothetical protein
MFDYLAKVRIRDLLIVISDKITIASLSSFLILLLMPVPITHSSFLKSLSDGDKTYENKQFGLKVQYPNNWRNSEQTGPVDYAPERILTAIFSSPPNKDAPDYVLAWINVDKIEEGDTLEKRKNMLFKNLNELPDFSQSSTTLSGAVAVRTDFFNDDVGQIIIGIDAIKNNLLYSLSITGEPDTMDKHKHSIQKIMDTLEITSIDSANVYAARIPPSVATNTSENRNNCDSSYPDVCIPTPPPPLSCADIPLTPFSVIGTDPHGFDIDNDGIGCESRLD